MGGHAVSSIGSPCNIGTVNGNIGARICAGHLNGVIVSSDIIAYIRVIDNINVSLPIANLVDCVVNCFKRLLDTSVVWSSIYSVCVGYIIGLCAYRKYNSFMYRLIWAQINLPRIRNGTIPTAIWRNSALIKNMIFIGATIIIPNPSVRRLCDSKIWSRSGLRCIAVEWLFCIRINHSEA